MAIVTVSVSDSAPFATKWTMPGNYEGLRSPIPRGLITFAGDDAIALLGAGDETNYELALVMPAGYAYLPKTIQLSYESDDLVANFGLVGFGRYVIFATAGARKPPLFNIVSPGEVINGAAEAGRIWTPERAVPKLSMLEGDQLQLRVQDMTTGGSTAGDMNYFVQMYVFDRDQVDKWEVNTPIPTISHTAF